MITKKQRYDISHLMIESPIVSKGLPINAINFNWPIDYRVPKDYKANILEKGDAHLFYEVIRSYLREGGKVSYCAYYIENWFEMHLIDVKVLFMLKNDSVYTIIRNKETRELICCGPALEIEIMIAYSITVGDLA